jgi:diguanylate cyclase (GGDEF)-like protein
MGLWPSLRTRLSARLFAVFVLAAVLPLGLSDWLASTAAHQVAQRFNQDYRDQLLRLTSRQVFDRLHTGKALLATLPPQGLQVHTGTGNADGSTQRLMAVFASLAWLDAPGHIGWSSEPSTTLLSTWDDAAPRTTPPRRLPVPAEPQGDPTQVSLRVDAATGRPVQVLLGATTGGVLRWVAELRPEVLWQPVVDADMDAHWRIHDADGHLLLDYRGPDVPPDGAQGWRTGSEMLFLGAEFDADDWRFDQASPLPEVRWQGLPLRLWLGLGGVGTLLLVALLTLRELRRALQPLSALTEGASRLADGAHQTRVSLHRDDELGALGLAFNHMAARIEDREQQLRHRAAHDSLTGLANRDGLHEQLDRALQAGGQAMAVLFLDLDHFKDINDSRGHEAGDAVLRAAAQRLAQLVPPGGLVARQGGDEFVIVLPGADAGTASHWADRAIQALSRPYRLAQGDVLLGASVGIALCPSHGQVREELLRCADIALYVAKAQGRGRHEVFLPALDQAVRERQQVQMELHLALQRAELRAYYQARVSAVDGAVVSAEALVRWQHPTRGLLLPNSFIQVAEQSGLINELGLQMLDLVCAQVALWRAQAVPLARVSVNVSPQQLTSGELPTQVRQALDKHQVPPELLELEITESLLVGDPSAACAQLAMIRSWGVTVAMDDFGTGYSSLASLQSLPIDVMKIDRAFVQRLGEDDSAFAIASAIVALAQALKLHLIAEGIETEAQADVLRDLGCHELQGFLYSRAVPADDLVALINSRQTPPAQA